jgi:CheY-like chemotaxis protein
MEESQKTEKVSTPVREKQPFLPDEGTGLGGNDSGPSVGGGRKILVVDDNPVVVRALELKLKASGFSVITAADGAEGIRIARKEKPELIVLDINFRPTENFSSLNWDGITIMQWLRKVQDVSSIPVVILTMEDPSRYKEATVAGGAAAFFQKPVDYKAFLGAILQLLGNAAPARQN